MISILASPLLWLKALLDYTFQMGTTSNILLGTVTLLALNLWFRRHRSDYPPCPLRPLPIVGNLHQMQKEPQEQVTRFREKCGDLFSIYLGTTHVIFLNGYDLIKEALVNRGDEFSERSVFFFDVATHTVNKGIFASNGEAWRQNRTVSINILRKFGMGKNILAQKIQEEVDHYLELLESFQGQPQDVGLYTMMSVSNVTCSIIVGHRFDYNDKLFIKVMHALTTVFKNVIGTDWLNWYPSLRFLPGDLFKGKLVAKNLNYLMDIFVQAHLKENENVTGEPNNYISAYRQEMMSKKMPHLNESNLKRCTFDLFGAATETTTSTITWFMLLMLNYPHIQDKIFSEIEVHIGMTRTPTMQDKQKLPYLSAAILETQRFANIAIFLFPRTILKDTTLGGYTLPKGSQFMINMASIMHDKSVWGEDADKFRPERFMSKDGKVFSPPEQWTPFSLGRRACLGEGLAKTELFLFLSNILQKFKLLPADEKSIPPLKGQLCGVNAPPPFQMRLVKRV